jgi:hypothetical protein
VFAQGARQRTAARRRVQVLVSYLQAAFMNFQARLRQRTRFVRCVRERSYELILPITSISRMSDAGGHPARSMDGGFAITVTDRRWHRNRRARPLIDWQRAAVGKSQQTNASNCPLNLSVGRLRRQCLIRISTAAAW